MCFIVSWCKLHAGKFIYAYEDSRWFILSYLSETESLYNDDYDSDNNTPVTEIEDGIFEADFKVKHHQGE